MADMRKPILRVGPAGDGGVLLDLAGEKCHLPVWAARVVLSDQGVRELIRQTLPVPYDLAPYKESARD